MVSKNIPCHTIVGLCPPISTSGPSMPYREARSVAESSEGPTASKSDRTGRNPGMTRLVRRSSAMSGGTALNQATVIWLV